MHNPNVRKIQYHLLLCYSHTEGHLKKLSPDFLGDRPSKWQLIYKATGNLTTKCMHQNTPICESVRDLNASGLQSQVQGVPLECIHTCNNY